jgi:uncharacterized protein (DUF3084 family)
MRNKPPTPETDKFKIKLKTLCGEKYWVPVEHSERLEHELNETREELIELRALELNHEGACVRLKRERDEAREDLKNMKKLHCDQSTEMLKLVFENRNLEQKADTLKEMLDM